MRRSNKNMWLVDDKTPPPSTLDFALAYAKLGWYVLPVWSVNSEGECRCGRPTSGNHKAGKHPQSNLALHGHNSATTDVEILTEWFTTDPEAGIGISMAASGLVALDIDPQNGGWGSLEKIESQHGILHSDCIATTQGGGEHRLFQADPDLNFPATLAVGLDLKHHGYICVAPTLGTSGVYSWQDGHSPLSKSNPAAPSALPKYIASQVKASQPYTRLTEKAGVPVATAQTFDDIKSALHHLDASDYETWVNVGLILRPYGETGYRIWNEWSATSPDNYDPDDAREKWERDLTTPHSITYRSIFRQAMDKGWKQFQTKPETPTENETEIETPQQPHPYSLSQAHGSGATEISPLEYVFDNFVSTGIQVIAGAPGVGKTTLIIPLALAAAHLCSVDFEMRPTIRRNVIFISESVLQVQRVIYSLYNWGNTGFRAEDFEERIRLLEARRLSAEVISEVAEEFKSWTYPNLKADGTSFDARPLLVLDTASSTFLMENENDNSEVSNILSSLKENFGASYPIFIITHTPKSMGNSDSEMLSPRGASSWAGDAHGVYTVFSTEETETERNQNNRIMRATKIRFPAAFTELTFNIVQNSEPSLDILGYPSQDNFIHSIARPLFTERKENLKRVRKETLQDQKETELGLLLINLIIAKPEHTRSYYERLPSEEGGIRASQVRKKEALSRLLEEGKIKRVQLKEDEIKGRADHYLVAV